MEAEMKMALQPPRDLRAETCRLVIWGLVLAMLAWAWRGAEMKPWRWWSRAATSLP